MRFPGTRGWCALPTAIALVGAAGCAVQQNPALERARASYATAERSREVVTYAKPELVQAGSTLRRAENAFETSRDDEDVDHLALMSEKQVDIARSKASERSAEAETKVLSQARDAMVAERERERTELELRLADLEARETERGLVVTLGDVLFETDKAELKPGALSRLSQLVAVLRENPDRAVLVEGHADSRGTDAYNLSLSERRANVVRGFLIRNGIGAERVVATGYGEEYPVASNATAEGQTMNRRVEVVMLNANESPTIGRLTIR
ncbi:MAG TPA: OmpA family protein [Candidatus Binatia bacterium]|nr:OmpA family protein [Candidatus Binatia bacterium]